MISTVNKMFRFDSYYIVMFNVWNVSVFHLVFFLNNWIT